MPLYLCVSNLSEIIPFSSTALQRYFILYNVTVIRVGLTTNFLTHFIGASLSSGDMSHFCSARTTVLLPLRTFSAVRCHPGAMITAFRISLSRGCLNDEKVGAVKIAGQENVSRVYPIFFFPTPVRNGVMRPRRIPKANYRLVTTVGTTFYAITRLCFTAGALTHLPGLITGAIRVSLHYAETFSSRRHRRYSVIRPTTSCFSARETRELSSSISAAHIVARGKSRKKITDNERYQFSFFA